MNLWDENDVSVLDLVGVSCKVVHNLRYTSPESSLQPNDNTWCTSLLYSARRSNWCVSQRWNPKFFAFYLADLLQRFYVRSRSELSFITTNPPSIMFYLGPTPPFVPHLGTFSRIRVGTPYNHGQMDMHLVRRPGNFLLGVIWGPNIVGTPLP